MKTLVFLILGLTCQILLAGGALKNSKLIQTALDESSLVVTGKITNIQQRAFFDHEGQFVASSKTEAKKALPDTTFSVALYTATLNTDLVLKAYGKTEIEKKIYISWLMTASLKGDDVDLMLRSFCPPISVNAYRGNSRIWFLKFDHGTWRVLNDQHPWSFFPKKKILLIDSIKQVMKTGKASTLDEAYQNQFIEGDLFTD